MGSCVGLHGKSNGSSIGVSITAWGLSPTSMHNTDSWDITISLFLSVSTAVPRIEPIFLNRCPIPVLREGIVPLEVLVVPTLVDGMLDEE